MSIMATIGIEAISTAEAAGHTRATTIADITTEVVTAYSAGWIAAVDRAPIVTKAIAIGWIAVAGFASTIGWMTSYAIAIAIALSTIRTKANLSTTVEMLVLVAAVTRTFSFVAI